MNKPLLLAVPLLIGAGVAVTLYLNPLAPSPQPTAQPLPGQMTVPATAAPLAPVEPTPAAAESAALSSLPPSFAGTEVDGQFRLDDAGNLLISMDIRRIFDYFLSAYGEERIQTASRACRPISAVSWMSQPRARPWHCWSSTWTTSAS